MAQLPRPARVRRAPRARPAVPWRHRERGVRVVCDQSPVQHPPDSAAGDRSERGGPAALDERELRVVGRAEREHREVRLEAGRELAEAVRDPECARAERCRHLDQRSRCYVGFRTSKRPHLAEQIEVDVAGRGVGSDAHRDAGPEQRSGTRRRVVEVDVRARARHGAAHRRRRAERCRRSRVHTGGPLWCRRARRVRPGSGPSRLPGA